LILALFNALIGKLFCNGGERYEGEFKYGKTRGQGKKNDILILTLFNTLIGKFFCNDGNTFEGEWEAGWINGKGKKFDSKGKLIEEGKFAQGFLITNFWITNHFINDENQKNPTKIKIIENHFSESYGFSKSKKKV